MKAFTCNCFISLSCDYPGAAPITIAQAAILNLSHPYLRSTTVLLDTKARSQKPVLLTMDRARDALNRVEKQVIGVINV